MDVQMLKTKMAYQWLVVASFALLPLREVVAQGPLSITYSGNYSWNSAATIYGSQTSVSLTAPKFNASLGTLEEVRLSVSTDFSGSAACEAGSGVFVPPFWLDNWTWRNYYFSNFSGPGLSATANSLQSASGGGNYSDPTHTASASVSGKFMTGSASLFATSSNQLQFAQYTGGGTVSLAFVVGHQSVSPPLPLTAFPGGFDWGISNVTAAAMNMQSFNSFSVSYVYTPVPEPQSCYLVSLAVISVLLAKRLARVNGSSSRTAHIR